MKSESTDSHPKKRLRTKLKTALGHAGLLVALMLYTAIGGVVFSELERPVQEAELADLHALANSERKRLLAAFDKAAAESTATFGDGSDNDTTVDGSAKGQHFLEPVLSDYECALERAIIGGVKLPLEDSGPPASRWNLLQAVFFASTVLTTIGYGNMVPSTFWGRVFCMLYAIVGIPLTLTVIADMGRLLASAVSELHARVRRHTSALPAPPALPARVRRPLTMLAALAALLLYFAAGSGIIRLWESEWSFFEGFYFCFITMTTIGFGDLVPTKADYMMPCTLYILAGLALTSTIIELVRRQYAQSWRHLQALSGPLADSLRRLGESAALAGSGIDVTALQRMLTIVSMPKRNQNGENSAKARAEWEQAMAAVLREIAAPPQRQPSAVLQIVIYETTV